MKRLIAMILFLAMLWMVTSALAADLTLPVKMQRQMQHDGNGMKGSIQIHSNADPVKDPFLYAVQNAEFDILRNASGAQWHMIFFQPDETEQQKNRTEFYFNGEKIYLRSDFLPDQVYNLSEEAVLATFLNVPRGENPTILPALLSMFTLQDNKQDSWDPVIARYSKMLELWMGDYFTEPEMIRNEDGSSWMRITYLVPYADVCSEIAQIITTAASDPEVTALLSTILTEEEKNLYFNPSMGVFYEEALKNLQLTGDIQFEKTVTAMGDMISSEIKIPLSEEITGYSMLDISSRDHTTSYTISGNKQVICLDIPENLQELTANDEYEMSAYVLRCAKDAENFDKNYSYSIKVVRTTEKSYDEETSKEHEIHRYTISLEQNKENLPETVLPDMIPSLDPISMDIELHYSGKTGPNAPTTLNINAQIIKGDLNVSIEGKIKTASTWPFVPFSAENAVQLISLKDEAASGYIREWIANATTGIKRLEESTDTGIQTVEGE